MALLFFSQPVSGLEHDNSLYKFLDVLLRIVGSLNSAIVSPGHSYYTEIRYAFCFKRDRDGLDALIQNIPMLSQCIHVFCDTGISPLIYTKLLQEKDPPL